MTNKQNLINTLTSLFKTLPVKSSIQVNANESISKPNSNEIYYTKIILHEENLID